MQIYSGEKSTQLRHDGQRRLSCDALASLSLHHTRLVSKEKLIAVVLADWAEIKFSIASKGTEVGWRPSKVVGEC